MLRNLDANGRGALFMVVSSLGFTLNDTIMKLVLGDLPLFEAVFLRGVAASVLLLVLCWRTGAFAAGALQFSWPLAARVIAELGSTILFFSALQHIPIADTTAITQATPLVLTLIAGLFLGERVGWRRYLAVVIGFFGVLLIVQPGTGSFSAWSLFALASVGCVVVRDLFTARLDPNLSSLFVAFQTALGSTLFAGAALFTQPWVPLDGRHFGLLGAAAGLLCVGYLFSVMTMRVGDVSFSAPFRYASLVWAILTGLVVFGDWPDLLMLIGSCIVVGTGIYTFYRERRLRQDIPAKESFLEPTG